ncbi:MAG TPA: 3-dehydroquinate synthase [Flavisolibacter sp.]|nr:3-dehydroquinate synthase [Flavisolibacter sp.]
MDKKTFRFSTATVDYYFGGGFSKLKEVVDPKKTVLITDENIYGHHTAKFKKWDTIVLKPGEQFKVQATVDTIIDQLIEMGADRSTTLVGVGGGVITDLTGYVASIYMRGLSFGFVPTTLLALVDASIGGKNGVDVGIYKNMAGTIRQPTFILHDLVFLNTLPEVEWRSGFAEIIKHASIKDAAMFNLLEENTIGSFQKKKKQACELIQRNALIKTKVVLQDEFEKGDRKMLNFGHTLGHALENQYELTHGEAISIGMAYAANLSQQITGFKQADRVVSLLDRYQLPTFAQFNKDKVIDALSKDKKKVKDSIQFILLQKIGKAVIQPIPIDQIYQSLS